MRNPITALMFAGVAAVNASQLNGLEEYAAVLWFTAMITFIVALVLAVRQWRRTRAMRGRPGAE